MVKNLNNKIEKNIFIKKSSSTNANVTPVVCLTLKVQTPFLKPAIYGTWKAARDWYPREQARCIMISLKLSNI